MEIPVYASLASAAPIAADAIFIELVKLFGQAGVLYGFIWMLLKSMKEQYDSRITEQGRRIDFAESKIAECERDRHEIRDTLDQVREEQIKELRQMHELTVRMVRYHGLDGAG